MTDINRPLLGEPNAPCRTCGSPLAADQRYCLQCGARRAEARLPFLDILARQVPQGGAPATTTTGAATSVPAGNWLSRLSTNAAAVAGVACLLLALGVGVLIGGLGSGDSAASGGGAPQVITVSGAAPAAAPAAAAPAASTGVPAATGDESATGSEDSSSKPKSSKKAASSAGDSDAVKKLDSSAGGDYAKKSEKLPKTLGTGGEPPPIDKSKPAGGGSDVESIG